MRRAVIASGRSRVAFARRVAVTALATALLLAGCTGGMDAVNQVLPQNEPAYKSSRSVPPLEIPPDLSKSTINDTLPVPGAGGGAKGTTYSAYRNENAANRGVEVQSGVLPRIPGVHVAGSGDKRWLVVDAPPSEVWPRVREFWLAQGFVLTMDDPSIGIMETDWAEKRNDFRSGVIEKLLGKLTTALYGTATRDKFRTRLERTPDGHGTEIYVSHRGAEEVVETTTGPAGEDHRVWQPRPPDPELEAEMLNRMMVSFGVEQKRATRMIAQARKTPHTDRARLVRSGDGSTSLALKEDFSRAWRRTGLALDRVGFTVEDRDRSRGLFYVRYVDPEKDSGQSKSFFSKLKFWGNDSKPKDDSYLISLIGGHDSTQVVVLDKQGKRDNSDTADKILSLLQEQLR